MSLFIRKANIEDVNAITNIIYEVVPIMNRQNNYQWNELYPLRKDFENDINNDILWVATSEDDEVIGVAALDIVCPIEYKDAGCDMNAKCIVPHRLAVHPDHQGKGVAVALMNKAKELALQKEYKHVRVDTNTANNKMQNMFTKLGFVNKGEIKLIGKPEDQTYVCYELELQ